MGEKQAVERKLFGQSHMVGCAGVKAGTQARGTPNRDGFSQHQQPGQKGRVVFCGEDAWSPRNGPCRALGGEGSGSLMASYLLHSGLGELCHSSRKDSSHSLFLSLFYSFIQLLKPKSFMQLFQCLSLTVGFALKDAQHLSSSCHLPQVPTITPGLLPLLAFSLAALTSHLCTAARDTLFTHQSDNVSLLRELPFPLQSPHSLRA